MRFDVSLANPPYSIKESDREAFAFDGLCSLSQSVGSRREIKN